MAARITTQQTKLQELQDLSDKTAEYKHRIQQLTTQLLLWESDTAQHDRRKQEMEELVRNQSEQALLLRNYEARLAATKAAAIKHETACLEAQAKLAHAEAQLAQRDAAVDELVRRCAGEVQQSYPLIRSLRCLLHSDPRSADCWSTSGAPHRTG